MSGFEWKSGFFSPPSAATDTSIAFLWNKPEQATVSCYYLYLDNKLHGITAHTDYTAEGLAPETEYTAYVQGADAVGGVAYTSESITVSTKPQTKLYDIIAFGAVGDGVTINTAAIQSAINACAHGGTVYVPAGCFVTGAIFLKSNMTLLIEKNARLQGSPNTADYPLKRYLWEGRECLCYASLINTAGDNGEGHQNITIAGEGTIDACGRLLFHAEMAEHKGERGRTICLRNVDGVYLKDFVARNSPSWCVHLICCDNISINNIEVHTKYDEHGMIYKDIFNGDGIDTEYCSNAYIFNSLIASQDDCIAVKSGRDEEGRAMGISSRNIRITNCVFRYGFGVAIGSEMSGGVENVWVQDCVFEDTYSIGTIKAPRERGGFVRSVTYIDCTHHNDCLEHSDCKWFRGAINIDRFYGLECIEYHGDEAADVTNPVIRDITFKNIVLDTHSGNAVFIAGLPENPITRLHLENIHAIGKYGMKAYNVHGLMLNNVRVTAREGENLFLHNVVDELTVCRGYE